MKPERRPARRVNRRRGSSKNCPIGTDSLQVASLSHDLVQAIRKLRRNLIHCRLCRRFVPDQPGCATLSEFNGWLDQAIQEVVEEWQNGTALEVEAERMEIIGVGTGRQPE